MASIDTGWNGLTKLKDWWSKVKTNFININTQLANHVAGAADKHAAEEITYDGIAGGTEVKMALNNLRADINNIEFTGSDHDALVTGALIDAESEDFGPDGTATYLDGRLTKWEEKTIAHLAESMKERIMNKYAINIGSVYFPTLTAYRRAKRLTGIEIIGLGDSHSWGQGSPNCDFGLTGSASTRYAPYAYSMGYYKRIEEYLKKKYDSFYQNMVEFYKEGASSDPSTKDYATSLRGVASDDLYHQSEDIKLISGILKHFNGLALQTPEDTNFYIPPARSLGYDLAYGESIWHQKFFQRGVIFAPNINDKFRPPYNEDMHITVGANGSYSEAGTFTQYKWNNGLYYAFLTADHTTHFFHILGQEIPEWLKTGCILYLSGFGKIKVSSISYVSSLTIKGYNILITAVDGSTITQDLSPYIYPGCKMYYVALTATDANNAVMQYKMKHYATRMYLGAVKHSAGGKLNIYFKESMGISEINPFSAKSYKSTYFAAQRTGYPLVYRMVNGVETLLTSPEVTISSNIITIDTYAASMVDVVYVIDWGQKQKGLVSLEYNGANGSASNYQHYESPVLLLRGFFFDANIFKNHSMGANPVGGWIGTEPVAGETRDHIADLQNYIVYTPSLLLIQAPVVNEYSHQTPFADLVSDLDTLIEKLNSHRANDPDAKNMDVLVFTTIGDKSKEFGTDTATRKYDDYFAAFKQYCIDNNYGFVDFRAWAKEAVNKSIIDAEMLFDDDIHPSPFLNEFIANELINIIDLIM